MIDNGLSLNRNVSNIQIFQIIWALIFVTKIFKKSIVLRKCIMLGEALRIRIKKFKHNLPENY